MKLTDIILKEEYEKNNIKLMGDVILPIDKQMVLQAEEDTYNRGLLVTNNKDKSYDVAYWAGKFEPYPIEVEIDGKSVSKDAKKIKLLFHPEMDEALNESISLSEPNEDMEKLISRGIKRINIGSSDEEDVLYDIHNNWMGGYISAEEAMKKISKYLDPR